MGCLCFSFVFLVSPGIYDVNAVCFKEAFAKEHACLPSLLDARYDKGIKPEFDISAGKEVDKKLEKGDK
jgi:hypothetical protein